MASWKIVYFNQEIYSCMGGKGKVGTTNLTKCHVMKTYPLLN